MKFLILNLIKILLLSVVLQTAIAGVKTKNELSNDGLELARKIKASNIGWGNSVSHMKIILRDVGGNERSRNIRTMYYELLDEGDKSIVVFDSPRDVKGTAFLNHSHINAADDQWLYLPEIKRTKRISSHNKSGSFMGSEFSYEDFGSFEVKKYQYKKLMDANLNGVECFVLETKPVYKYSGYSRMVKWFDKKHLRLRKTEYYDKKNTLLKTLLSEDYHLYLGKYWRAHQSTMKNHLNGMSTRLAISKIDFQIGLMDSDFTKSNLKRIR